MPLSFSFLPLSVGNLTESTAYILRFFSSFFFFDMDDHMSDA